MCELERCERMCVRELYSVKYIEIERERKIESYKVLFVELCASKDLEMEISSIWVG